MTNLKEFLGNAYKSGMTIEEAENALAGKNLVDLSTGEYVSKAKYISFLLTHSFRPPAYSFRPFVSTLPLAFLYGSPEDFYTSLTDIAPPRTRIILPSFSSWNKSLRKVICEILGKYSSNLSTTPSFIHRPSYRSFYSTLVFISPQHSPRIPTLIPSKPYHTFL